MASSQTNGVVLQTRILPVNATDLGKFKDRQTLDTWELLVNQTSLEPLREAAAHLRESNIPVGFPTETVYGLGADATRSDAVKGIYKAKGRPSDNPLIIHVCDLNMLRSLLTAPEGLNGNSVSVDSIPAIYKPLIKRFWPGPLTILLPNPQPSKLAPEVTAGLPTFGARMPDSPLALSLIHLAGVPLAAPSANASTKPSPTTAEHVKHDLEGKIEIILDGGACQVGVESTVVDGLCDPPVVLRPGGVSIDRIRECEGWSGVVKGYKDHSEIGGSAPRAPGMKYKHYSPKAKVVLFEAIPRKDNRTAGEITGRIPLEGWRLVQAKNKKISYLGLEDSEWPIKIGMVTTKHWESFSQFHFAKWNHLGHPSGVNNAKTPLIVFRQQELETSNSFAMRAGELWEAKGILSSLGAGMREPPAGAEHIADVLEISLGSEVTDIAHGLFSALRELDQRGVDIIYVEGIEDEGDIAAAVMNRLRKAASVIEK
ncbi:translation factor [Hyaloscypha variabilis F]|uniref:Threonylcarbamoyl-AMP synthase n=1 Tax=Hyaloscypha variabilis (strain UAMH 11265 / GT02V1 / F) TaxID=1149755 RepID=A0A2J6R2H3_HYAVF|nr:translation factor [Hyaloscypha variabilis F]